MKVRKAGKNKDTGGIYNNMYDILTIRTPVCLLVCRSVCYEQGDGATQYIRTYVRMYVRMYVRTYVCA
jgi:hypothetical protein